MQKMRWCSCGVPSPPPLSQAWERGAAGGVRDKCCDCYRHKSCVNEKRGISIKVNTLAWGIGKLGAIP